MRKKPAKPGAAKKPPPWAPVPVAVQVRQHQAALKAAKTRRAHAAAAKKHPAPAARHAVKKPVKRKLALGETVACCAAEALAASLRLAGWPVSDADVLALYELTATEPDEGATILATLEAATEHGLGSRHPLNATNSRVASFGQHPGGAVILGVDLPGPHAVCDDGTWWWSWGEPWDPADFPLAVIEEAWEVTW